MYYFSKDRKGKINKLSLWPYIRLKFGIRMKTELVKRKGNIWMREDTD
jgi:hypothetical protein